MKKTRLIPIVLSVAAGMAQAQPVWFKVTTITPPAGHTGVMYPNSINDLGQVVGKVYSASGYDRAFIWLPTPAYGYPAGPSVLDNFGGLYSEATGINNAGQVSGSTVNPQWDVARWDLAVSHTPVVLRTQGYTKCINSLGVVGGMGVFANPGCPNAGIFSSVVSNAMVTNTECTNAVVMGLNANGYAVGNGFQASNKGFFASGPGYAASELPNFAGVTGQSFYTLANAVNEDGQVAVQVNHPSLGCVAAIFKDLNGNGIAEPATEYTILSTPVQGTCGAYAINNAGAAGGVRASDNGGMLWVGGKEIGLNQAVFKDASGYPVIHGVTDINDLGQVLCKATTAQGELAVILTPMCYPDCDAFGGLSANDFQCFMNKFAVGSRYANCDESTSGPMLTANDFQCYLNKFAAGCGR